MSKNMTQEFYNDIYKDTTESESPCFKYYRNRYLPEMFPVVKDSRVILDIGCGNGFLCEWLKGRGYKPIGIDISPDVCIIAEKKGIKVYCIDVDEEDLPLEDSSVDEIFMGDFLEHIMHVEHALKEAYRVLKLGGELKFTIPNMGFIPLRIRYLLTGQIPPTNGAGGKYRHDLPWRWEHIRFYNWSSIQLLFKTTGFEIVTLKGIADRPFSILSKLYPPLFAHNIIGVCKKR